MKHSFIYTALSDVQYDEKTGLFPYSPRVGVDKKHVEQLIKSITETGFWDPIYIRAGTHEGIAGNHRFLAAKEIAKAENKDLTEYKIPAIEVNCDEGEAVLLALLENDIRLNLTQYERTTGIVKSARRKQKKIEKVLGYDKAVIEQLSLWPKIINHYEEIARRQKKLESQLSKEWLQVINQYLADFPALRKHFIKQLRNPLWVSARSIEKLKDEILLSIFSSGKNFKADRTWNGTPTPTCVEDHKTFADFEKKLKENPEMIDELGYAKGTCKHLRFKVLNAKVFTAIPNGGAIFIPSSKVHPISQSNSDKQNGQAISGEFERVPISIQGYCLDPDIGHHASCFHYQESEARKAVYQQLNADPARIASSLYINERKALKKYLWLEPIRENNHCTPQNCLHTGSELCCVVELDEEQNEFTYCIDEVCGKVAEQVQNKNKYQQHLKTQELTLQKLSQRRVKIADTYFFSGQHDSLEDEEILDLLEEFLSPKWISEAMKHMAAAFAQHPDHTGTDINFASMRKNYVTDKSSRIRWLICLLKYQIIAQVT